MIKTKFRHVFTDFNTNIDMSEKYQTSVKKGGGGIFVCCSSPDVSKIYLY